MIELGPGADLLRGIGAFFWLLVLGALAAALFKPRTWIGKLIATSIVIGLFVAYPGRWAWERKKEVDAYHAALAKAEAVFHERCKTAGEKIYKTVDNVEGFLLLKTRDGFKMDDQNADDPFGNKANSQGDDYIMSFLTGYIEEARLFWGGSVPKSSSLAPAIPTWTLWTQRMVGDIGIQVRYGLSVRKIRRRLLFRRKCNATRTTTSMCIGSSSTKSRPPTPHHVTG